MKSKELLLVIFFLLLQLVVYLGNTPTTRYDVFFWYCNHISLFFAIGFFFRRYEIVKGLISVGFLSQLLWALDFIGFILFDVYLFNVTRYVFEDLVGIGVLVPISIHLLTTNLALYFTYDKKISYKSLIWSFFYLIIMFVMTLLFTLKSNNINCIYDICGLGWSFPGYTYLWIFIVFIIMVLPVHYFQVWLYRMSSRVKKKKV